LKVIFITISFLVGAVLYFEYNPSYKLSMEAKFYFTLSDYERSYQLADEALKIREYNTMAFHIKTRSQFALDVMDFNREAKDFEAKILSIIKSGSISKGDKNRVKMMSDVIISKYNNLSLNLVDDKDLTDEAQKHFSNFEKINREVIEALKN
jgi:hypothetical protein